MGYTACIRGIYGLYMWDAQPAYVGCKLRAAKVGLSTHDSRIYTDSLQQKQAILRLFEPYWTILLMRDTRFLVV